MDKEMTCRVCKTTKLATLFYRDNRAKSGYRSRCKDCEREYNKHFIPSGFLSLKDYRNHHFKLWYRTPGGKQKHRERAKKHYHDSKHDPRYRLEKRAGNSLWHLILYINKGKGFKSFLGYTADEVKRRFEPLFYDNMSWSNYGQYWEVDHIKPRSNFTYSSEEDSEFWECWSLDNLQPLTKEDNRAKSNKERPPIKAVAGS